MESSPLPAATGTARSVRARRATAGSTARRAELLPTPYAHVVFTVPHQLAPLALQNKELIYGLLFRCQRTDSHRDRRRSHAPRRRDRLLQRSPYLESEAAASSPRSLRRRCRWSLSRPYALGTSSKSSVLSSKRGSQRSLSRQVSRSAPAGSRFRTAPVSRPASRPDRSPDCFAV